MSLDGLPQLSCLVMADGHIYAHVEEVSDLRPMEVRLGDLSTPFELSDSGPDHLAQPPAVNRLKTADLAQRAFSRPGERTPGDTYACWVNHLEDWTLEGEDTVQIMITRPESPCEVHLNQPLTLEGMTAPHLLEAYLAVHRARATLHIQMTDPATGRRESQRIPFEPGCEGGTQTSGYAHLQHPIPDHFTHCRIDLSIEYAGQVADSPEAEPFLFLAGVQVRPVEESTQPARAVEPALLMGEPPVFPGQWIRAQMPGALNPGQTIEVQLGTQVYPFMPLARPQFCVRENYGHTLVCSSSQAMALLLFIDGERVDRVAIKEGDTILRLPNAYLTGSTRHLSLKDLSGTVTLFEQQQLMPAIVTPADVMQRESVAPYPTTLFAQTPLRYAALKALLEAPLEGVDPAQLAHALQTLEGGHANVKLRPLRFPDVSKPEVSVIIPAHNGIELTYLTLCSLLLARNEASFEVIVVDDGSTDETAQLEKLVQGITVLHNASPQRFIRACNAGAEQARGRYIALLNNDTEVTVGWLDALLDAFRRFDKVGLAGSRLLYPDGTLQDAGGIVWNSGNPWNYGNRENPNDPRFCYARQADYLSGAALMMPRTLWNKVGGLSAELEPMYFEDTDLAFKVRAAGYSTWYVPSSVVYHFEGMTAGTDVTGGFKKYQEVNRPKFKRRWASAFAAHGAEGQNPDLEKDRGIVGRVLFIDYAPPRADKDAGSYAALQEMRLVQSLGYKVSFVSTNMAHLGHYTETLQRSGVEVIHAPFFMNITEYLDSHAADFDAFYITRYYVAQAVLRQIRSKAPKAKVLFNNADLHFLREMRAAYSADDPARLEQARQTREEELDVIRSVDVVLSYTEVEHSVIAAFTDGKARVVKCPWVVDVPKGAAKPAGRAGLSFLGSFRHHPNGEGISWFAKNVVPLLPAAGVNCALTIYGSGMGDEIKALASDQILPHGFVENLGDAFDRHRIFVAPLLSGAGIKGKVLAALARGIPCVISPIAAEGIGLRSGHDCLIVDEPHDWVAAIKSLQEDDALWTELSRNAQTYLRRFYSFESGRARMRQAFEAADLFGAKP